MAMLSRVPDRVQAEAEETSSDEFAPMAGSSLEKDWAIEDPPEAADESPLQRTQSQAVKRIKVDEVTRVLEERCEPVEELRRVLSQLSKPPGVPEEGEDPEAKRELAAEKLRQADQLQQGFRNFGEDLMEGMLALDQLDNLAREDRLARKETIGKIQGLLDKIDGAKPRLEQLRKRLASELDQLELEPPPSHQAETSQVAGAPPGLAAVAEAAGCEEAVEVEQVTEKPPRPRQARPQLVMPRVDWTQVELPMEFSAAERPRVYVLSAYLPGLEPESVRLVRKEGGVLSIQGLRLPTAVEQKALERALAAHVRRLPRKHRQRLQQESVDELAAQLGRGRFGAARREFELPHDVDWQGIEASYDEGEGELRVVLPRVVPAARDLGSGGRGFQGYGPILRQSGYPSRTRAAGLPNFFMW